MVFALLMAAILWNLARGGSGCRRRARTPWSVDHRRGRGEPVDAGASGTSGVDWEQVNKVFTVLLISPLVGFGAAALVFLLFKLLIKYPAAVPGAEGQHASAVADSGAADSDLRRRELLPWIERRAEGHGPDHADPDRHGADGVCAEPCGDDQRHAGIHCRVDAGRTRCWTSTWTRTGSWARIRERK